MILHHSYYKSLARLLINIKGIPLKDTKSNINILKYVVYGICGIIKTLRVITLMHN